MKRKGKTQDFLLSTSYGYANIKKDIAAEKQRTYKVAVRFVTIQKKKKEMEEHDES